MKKIVLVAAAVLLLLPVLHGSGLAIDLNLGDLNIGVGGSPPPYEFRQEPELMPIPGRYAYYVSDIDVEILFYHGRWYRPYKDHWYMSDRYNGQWERIRSRDLPDALRDLPRDYRSTQERGYYSVPYGELRDNWEKWERDKYWDRTRAEERERFMSRRFGPPPVEFKGEPKLFPIPGRYVYIVADIDEVIFFYRGKWYRPYKDRWYMAEAFSGPWERIRYREVPDTLQDLPRVFYRVPYRELRDNWEKWEREKYWDRKRDEDRDRDRDRYRDERYRDR